MALESFVDADVVTGVPDSSISVAIGYAEQTGIPYELGLIKNKYTGRTFIQPSQSARAGREDEAERGTARGRRQTGGYDR